MKQKQQGFTLIELMIVVAIIGILSAIAIPAYQDFTTRSQVSELMLSAAACKNNVAEYYQTNGSFPTKGADAGCSNEGSSLSQAPTVADGTGVVTVLAAGKLAAKITTGKGVELTPVAGTNGGAITEWTCTGAGSLEKKFLPANCRG